MLVELSVTNSSSDQTWFIGTCTEKYSIQLKLRLGTSNLHSEFGSGFRLKQSLDWYVILLLVAARMFSVAVGGGL